MGDRDHPQPVHIIATGVGKDHAKEAVKKRTIQETRRWEEEHGTEWTARLIQPLTEWTVRQHGELISLIIVGQEVPPAHYGESKKYEDFGAGSIPLIPNNE